ncbi:MAG: glutamate ligase domain-containing protein [Gemmatimonadales bacterium]
MYRGRSNFYDVGGVAVLLDFAHNARGLAAVAEMARGVNCRRRLIILGQAGDRTDESIRELARSAMNLNPDLVVVREMEKYLRGREPGVIPKMLAEQLRECGLAESQLEVVDSEETAVRRAFEWSQPGDLLVLPVLVDRDAAAALVSELQDSGWEPGSPLPVRSLR